MNTKEEKKSLAALITTGPVKAWPSHWAGGSPRHKVDGHNTVLVYSDTGGEIARMVTDRGRVTEQTIANAFLIEEAFNVTQETGLTPRQLAEERSELVAKLQRCLGFYGDSTGYYHVSPDDRKAAEDLLNRIQPKGEA